jgi:two-component system chemotaxis response regulator CheY
MKRILIVDDAAFVREVLTQILLKHQFDVVGEAVDGDEAIQKASSLKPDLIIMDIVMPKKSGIQATLEILEANPKQKILACSTEGGEAMVMKALEAGCVDFITKPFKIESLIATIKNVTK